MERERIPTEWRYSNLTPIYKKGKRHQCTNYRGITLMGVIQKVMVITLNTRLMHWNKEKSILKDTQGAFQKGKGAEEFALGLEMMIHNELQTGREYMVMAQIDIEKAFDRVNRTFLWNKLRRMGMKGKFWRILQNIYEQTWTRVKI